MLELVEKGFVSLQALAPLLEDRLSFAVWVWDFGTGELKWSRGVYALLGLPADSVQPSLAVMEQFVHVADRRPQGEIERALREGVAVDRELRTIMPQGRVRWIRSQIIPILSANGSTVRAIGICTDITAYQERLHFHRLSGNRFNAICAGAQALIWSATPTGSTIELLNRSAPSKNGLDIRSLMHPDDRAEFEAKLVEQRRAREPVRMILRLRYPDDSYNAYGSRAHPVIDEHGNVYEWIGISFDLKAAEKTLTADVQHLTGAQIRAARAILRWSVAELAQAANVSPSVVRRLEEIDGASAPELAHQEIGRVCSQAGVEFVFPREGKPGVRPR